jgi:tetratricopeptide (TPR) repeat protein
MKVSMMLALLLACLVFGPAGHAQSSASAKEDASVLARAQSLIATGEYGQAEALLQPLATERPSGDAALELGLLQLMVGRQVEGRRTLQQVLLAESNATTARDYARAARASRALGYFDGRRFEDANSLYREASTLAPTDPAINTGWGDLFLEKHDPAEAVKSYQAALKGNPDYVPALVGMAKAVADDNPPAAKKYAQRALELNPNDASGHLVLADLAVDDDKLDDARAEIDKALKINPNHLEAHALKAAIASVQAKDAEYQASVAAALKINPLYGEVHRVVGAVTARFYRFDEAVPHTRRAISIDRNNSAAQADLGSHLLRTGDEAGARRALETAFRADPYNKLTYNSLELLDKIDKFATIREGDLIIKLPEEEAAVMREYVPALAQESLAALSKRWEFVPKGPILVEVFNKHDDFAVRTLGLPGMIGALGACFGRVVTMDSPKARPPGEFNWGATLWHEMAHVITLQLSNQRIPRWLTEGISVFEETRARKEWGREMELAFARAIEAGEILTVKDLNSGFQDPRTISLAYYEASLLVEHIVARFGEPKLRALVQSFADGIDSEAAIRKVLAVDVDDLQKSFDTFLGERFGALRRALKAPEGFTPEMPADKLKAFAVEHPGSFAVQMALGRALRGSDPGGAIQAYERAAALVPMSIGPEGAYMQIVEVAMAQGNKAKAAEALDRLTEQDHTDVEAARQLVGLLDPVKDAARLKVALQRVVAVDPFDAPSHTTLGRMALASGQAQEATRMFKVAVAAGPIDKASAQADLAEGYLLAGQRDEAKRAALAALEIAPTFSRAQDLLLKLIEGGKQ